MGRRPGLAPAAEGLDDDHVSTAAGAWRPDIGWLIRRVVLGCWGDGEKFTDTGQVEPAGAPSEEAVVTDAVEPAREQVKQEAANELVGVERHDLLPLGTIAAVVLVAEGDAGLVEGQQPPVRNGDAVMPIRAPR